VLRARLFSARTARCQRVPHRLALQALHSVAQETAVAKRLHQGALHQVGLDKVELHQVALHQVELHQVELHQAERRQVELHQVDQVDHQPIQQVVLTAR